MTSERESWLEARKKGIGGSDAAAVMGASPWKSGYSLWQEKTGLAVEDVEPEWMKWGTKLEPLIAEAFEEETGREVRRPEAKITVHSTRPYMFASLDYEIEDVDPLECKTLSFFKADEWANEPPLHYQIQIQHQFAVTGAQKGCFAALIGGQKFVWCAVERNQPFIDELEAACEKFWWSVVNGKPPEVDGSESTTKTLKRLYPVESGATKQLSEEALRWAAIIENADERIAEHEATKNLYRNRLMAEIGDASEAFVPDGPRWTYRTQARAEHTVKGSAFRVLRKKASK